MYIHRITILRFMQEQRKLSIDTEMKNNNKSNNGKQIN